MYHLTPITFSLRLNTPGWTVFSDISFSDHLGNTRLLFTDRNKDRRVQLTGPTSEITQQLDYYPFGLQHQGDGFFYPEKEPVNRYRYNGKEFSEELGLYAYGFRYYDSAIGRFTGADPIADQFAFLSTYNYASNDPITNIDLHGLQGVNFGLGMMVANKPEHNREEALNDIKKVGLINGAVVGTAATVIFAGPSIAGGITTLGRGVFVLGRGALSAISKASKPLLALEKSGMTVATNATADAFIQTMMNVAMGKDPVENYDVIGLGTSFLAFPGVASAIDGVVDVSLSGVEINSLEESLATAIVGGTLGRAAGNVSEAIPKSFGNAKSISELILGVFNNGVKTAAGSTVPNEPTFQIPFLPKKDKK